MVKVLQFKKANATVERWWWKRAKKKDDDDDIKIEFSKKNV
jgi:hypothetical protein